MNVAIIPARGGSKRIPRKNIKEFCGAPMISYAIKTAKLSNLFEKIIISTDDQEIMEVSKSFGAEVPFVRPQNLADDITPTVPVVAHAITECKKLGMILENVCCIYPCAPFLIKEDLSNAYSTLIERGVDFVYPVTSYPHPVQRGMKMRSDQSMEFLFPEHELTRTQDLECIYHDAGQFYWGKESAWSEGKRMHTAGLGMEIPPWRVVDIDSEDDWIKAVEIYSTRFLTKIRTR
jgi:pseudaminic acid cytidylyltransferase